MVVLRSKSHEFMLEHESYLESHEFMMSSFATPKTTFSFQRRVNFRYLMPIRNLHLCTSIEDLRFHQYARPPSSGGGTHNIAHLDSYKHQSEINNFHKHTTHHT